MGNTHQFQWPDYLVFGLIVLVSLGIGVFYALVGRKRKTTSEFLFAGGKMSFLPVAISLLVSFESSITILGMPAEGYMHGLQIIIAYIPNMFTKIALAWVVTPIFHSLEITSAFEYLELRYKSRFIRQLGSIYGILFELLYMGLVLFGPAVALEAVTGFPMWMSIGGLALVAVLYTAMGGLKAVIWTDVIQAVVMATGILAVLIKGIISVGGPSAVWDTAEKGGRTEIFDFNPDPRVRHTFWVLTFATIVGSPSTIFKQSLVLRLKSIESVTKARKLFMFMAPAFSIVSIIAYFEGVVAYAYFVHKDCDPFAGGNLKNPNQIVPYTVLDMFGSHSGMPGLFLASLFSASLSTLSSCLTSTSALLTADFLRPAASDMAEWKVTVIAKLFVVICGVASVGLAWFCSLIGGTLVQITEFVVSLVSAPSTGLFVLACFTTRANAKGAMFGVLIGTICTSWISLGKSFTPGLKRTPFLPPTSNTSCEINLLTSNETDSWPANGQTMWESTANQTMASLMDVASTTLAPKLASLGRDPEGLEHLYSISYRLIYPFGLIVTVVFGYVASVLTGGNKPGDVDPRYLVDLSECCDFLPGCIRRRWRPESYKQHEFTECSGRRVNGHKVALPMGHLQKEVEPLVHNA